MTQDSSSQPTAAVRNRRVPRDLVGKSKKEILAWARGELDGQEASLTPQLVNALQSGEIRNVDLRPRKKGFFLKDGSFIEAFDYEPQFGDDLDEAEREWEHEEHVREWADAENMRFDKSTVEGADNRLRLMWEHGRETVRFATANSLPIFRLQKLLYERGGAYGYGLQTHQFCTEFYTWLPSASPKDPIFTWSWELVDSILRFSRNGGIRLHVMGISQSLLESRLNQRDMIRLLGTKGPDYYREDRLLTPRERETIGTIRSHLRNKKRLNAQHVTFIEEILPQSRQPPVSKS